MIQPSSRLRVADNGPGIPAHVLPHVFERFYRGSKQKTEDTPGTGLGLAICKEIVDRHRGHIEVQSQEGKGAVFTIWLQPTVSLNGKRP